MSPAPATVPWKEMKFAAEGKAGIGSTFEAESWEDAEKVCDKNGWILLGEIFREEMVSDEVEAMIYKNVVRPTLH